VRLKSRYSFVDLNWSALFRYERGTYSIELTVESNDPGTAGSIMEEMVQRIDWKHSLSAYKYKWRQLNAKFMPTYDSSSFYAISTYFTQIYIRHFVPAFYYFHVPWRHFVVRSKKWMPVIFWNKEQHFQATFQANREREREREMEVLNFTLIIVKLYLFLGFEITRFHSCIASCYMVVIWCKQEDWRQTLPSIFSLFPVIMLPIPSILFYSCY
jgi:hypothetical protein